MRESNRGGRLLRVLLPALTLLWLAFILGRSLRPAPESSLESGWFVQLFRRVIPSITDHAVRKLAHLTEFAVLGLLLRADFSVFGHKALVLPILCGLPAAVLDEGIQRFVPGRSGELRDVLIDGCGVVLGCLAAVLFSFLRDKRKRKKGKTQ